MSNSVAARTMRVPSTTIVKAIYLENKAAKFRDSGQTFSNEVLDDFKQFREAGLTHPDVEKIEALLTKTEQSDSVQRKCEQRAACHA
jgi:hypothetical protein